jgi:hypothetical protein
MNSPDRSAPRPPLTRGGDRRLKRYGRFAASLLEVLRRVELENVSPINAIEGGTACI